MSTRKGPKFHDRAAKQIDAKLRFCQKPDHDSGFLKAGMLRCGAPLPCPYHTVTIDLGAQTISEPFEANITRRQRRALKDIGQALKGGR